VAWVDGIGCTRAAFAYAPDVTRPKQIASPARHAKARSRVDARFEAGTPAATAVAALADAYGPRIRGLATRLCANRSDADDLVQEVFLQAFRSWPTFRGDADAGTWLHAIAARTCRRRFSRAAAQRMPAVSQLMPWSENRSIDLGSMASNSARGGDQGPVAAAIERESARAVHDAILSLPENFRVPLVLKEMLELSIEDVASALQIKPQTVKTRVHRARLLLRKAILDRRGMPTRAAKAPTYEKQVCLDLLKAKLDAMDHGRGFPIGQNVVCERCQAVFAELDLAQSTCARLAEGQMPARARKAILKAIAAQRDVADADSGRTRGRPLTRGKRKHASVR
jgi:RNA polymerase sigma-70 factor (ECF subfamily)